MSQDQPAPEFDAFKLISTFLPFIILWGWGKLGLDTADPVVLWGIRAFYIAAQLFTFGFVFWLESKIRATSTKPENAKIMKYVARRPATEVTMERATNPDAEEFEYKQQAVYEYDLEQCAQLKSYFPILITLGIHFYFAAVQPLVLQGFLTPMKLLENKEVKIHLLGHEMERPFYPEPSPFAGILGQKTEKEQMDEWDQAQQSKNKKNNKNSTAEVSTTPAPQIKDKKSKKSD